MSQPVKEDNLFKHTGLSGNFPIGSTKNMCFIYFQSGITGIFMLMVNNPIVNGTYTVKIVYLSTYITCLSTYL